MSDEAVNQPEEEAPGPEFLPEEQLWPGGRKRAVRLSSGGRSIKMLRPPFVSFRQDEYEVPIYEDIMDGEGNPTGERKLQTVETRVKWVPVLNWHEAVISPRVNSGRAFLKARNRGCILPQQLHTDDFPTGVAPCCEYRGCFNQKQANGEPLISTRYGQFCSEEQARMAYYDWEGTTPSGDRLEVDGLHVKSREKRRKQVASIPVERV